MKEASIIGLDLAKRSFQAHGALADGSVAFRKKLAREKVLGFLSCRAATLHRRHGGLLKLPSLGPGYP
jgi:hypothetical protein